MTIEITANRCCGEVSSECVQSEHSAATITATLDDPKAAVRSRYAAAATQGCGCGCDDQKTSFVGDAYNAIEGYVPQADLGLGCGLPTEIADLQPGDTVLDLGSGAGIDAFVARSIVGEHGRVIGVDFTPEMIALAHKNAADLGFENVHFIEGDIEAMPVPDAHVDVVISNCVLNLVPDKPKAFAEMRRVLRDGGRFCISDIVLDGELPERLRASAEAYAGCVSGAIDRSTYLSMLSEAGFENIVVRRSRRIEIPLALLEDVSATEQEISAFTDGGGISSVTVTGRRAARAGER